MALIFHLKIGDGEGYEKWLNESEAQFDGERLHRVKVDQAAREGMLVDEIIIDEHPSAQSSLAFMSVFYEVFHRVAIFMANKA